MPLWAGFIGGSYRARSQNLDAEVCTNLYVETIDSAADTKRSMLVGTPGLKNLIDAQVGDVGCRGCFQQDNRTFAVVGLGFYEVDVLTPSLTRYGTIKNDGQPVSIASNGDGGDQLAIAGGGELKIFDLATNTLSAVITTPLTNDAIQVVYFDGYFLLLEFNSLKIYFSALEDGTLWDALDFFARSQASDRNVGMIMLQGQLWVFGGVTTQIFYDSGDSDNPFLPLPGSLFSEGATTPWAINVLRDTVIWLAEDNQGHARVMQANSPSPAEITTPAVAFALAQSGSLADAELLTYEQEGHAFACLTVPNLCDFGQTWCYDLREQMWHQRAGWNVDDAVFYRWRARGLAQSNGLLLTGDFETGALYTIDLDTFTDNGGMIRRLRRAPYISNENQWIFLDAIEIGIESGLGTDSGQGENPQLMLEISRDSAHTWDPPMEAPIGEIGRYDARAIWTQLGRVRADRLVVQVTQTDPVRACYGPGLWVRVTPGTAQL